MGATPAVLLCREVFPDPAAPAKMRDPVPSVEVAFTTYYVNSSISLNSSASEWADINRLYEEVTAAELPAYLNWTARLGVLSECTICCSDCRMQRVGMPSHPGVPPVILSQKALEVMAAGGAAGAAGCDAACARMASLCSRAVVAAWPAVPLAAARGSGAQGNPCIHLSCRRHQRLAGVVAHMASLENSPAPPRLQPTPPSTPSMPT